ncbi:dATP/dGTP diphosphohydrolase domain-containing protein [Teichococcus vastitatis]|uniref:dATP/dGTP diphosphohydrolase domain-containing protein n=1 Tax=Teichococcus vastitatis TaxID=2307076 RepID=UPI000E74A12F|nr:dATP/dGTP diphosphohydrolase domain-containing protein [Pseudoroseomonas vastitatis]
MSDTLNEAQSWAYAFLDNGKKAQPDLAQMVLREDVVEYATGVSSDPAKIKVVEATVPEGTIFALPFGASLSDYATGVGPIPAPVKVENLAPPSGLQGKRFNAGKPRIDLVAPSILTAIGEVAAFGASKYGDRNWEKGMEFGKVYASLMRHLIAWWQGEEKDAESGLSHLCHIAWNVQAPVEYDRRVKNGTLPAEVDDRPHVVRTA